MLAPESLRRGLVAQGCTLATVVGTMDIRIQGFNTNNVCEWVWAGVRRDERWWGRFWSLPQGVGLEPDPPLSLAMSVELSPLSCSTLLSASSFCSRRSVSASWMSVSSFSRSATRALSSSILAFSSSLAASLAASLGTLVGMPAGASLGTRWSVGSA